MFFYPQPNISQGFITEAHQHDFYLLIAIGNQNVGCHVKFLKLKNVLLYTGNVLR